jgi:hypothetical protein
MDFFEQSLRVILISRDFFSTGRCRPVEKRYKKHDCALAAKRV